MVERLSIQRPKRAVHLVGGVFSDGYSSHGIRLSFLSSASLGKYYFSLVGLIVPSTFIKVMESWRHLFVIKYIGLSHH